MAFGYRVNIEDIFWKMAEENWICAQGKAQLIKSIDESKGYEEPVDFYGFTGEGMAYTCIAVMSWAVSLEATINLAWKHCIYPQLPQKGDIPDSLMRKLSSIEKLKEILKSHNVETGALPWLAELKELFRCRNEVVHAKGEVVFSGYHNWYPIQHNLSKNNVAAMREAAIAAIRKLSELESHLSVGFLDGHYEIETIDQ